MAGALGVVITTDVPMSGQHAQPVYVDDSLPIVGPSRAVVVTAGEVPQMGGPAIPVRLAPAGTPAIGPALPVYVVPGGGILDTLAYTNKVLALGPIQYLPQAESSGSVALDASGNGRNGAYTGVTLGVPGIGDGRTAARFDGATSYNNIYSASLNGAFTPGEFTAILWGKMSGAGVWTDGILRRLLRLRADASNDTGFYKDTVNNNLVGIYVAGGTVKTVVISTSTPSYFFIAMTVSKSGNAMKVYYFDPLTPFAQVGSTQTGLGTWAGALAATVCTVGAGNTTPNNVTSGDIAHYAVFSGILSSAQLATLAVVP